MKIRLHGTADECREVAERLAGVVEVLAVSAPYPDRGASVLVRVYVEARQRPRAPHWVAPKFQQPPAPLPAVRGSRPRPCPGPPVATSRGDRSRQSPLP